jgi:rod shape-determining protein MreC
MNNLLRLIIKYSFPIVFVIIEIICFTIFVSDNAFQRYKFINLLSGITNKITENWSEITDYVNLKTVNKNLQEENRILKESLEKYRYEKIPSLEKSPFSYISAKIVGKKINNTKNYFIINKGRNDNIHEGMGVISSEGVFGKIFSTTKNHSIILPITNPDSRISVKLSKSKHIGSLLWDNDDLHTAILSEIPGYVDIEIGDTIVTSDLSPTYPKNINIGTIKAYTKNNSTNFYSIDVDLFTDYSRLDYIYILKNEDYFILDSLIDND